MEVTFKVGILSNAIRIYNDNIDIGKIYVKRLCINFGTTWINFNFYYNKATVVLIQQCSIYNYIHRIQLKLKAIEYLRIVGINECFHSENFILLLTE
jgi:hypothetical protein